MNRKAGPGFIASTTAPRDAPAVKHILRTAKKQLSLGDNDIMGVIHVAKAFPDYVKLVNSTPDHNVHILVNPETLTEYRKMLQAMPHEEKAIHQLDTSFNFNEKYVTCLSFRHHLLLQRDTLNTSKTMPTIPLMTYIHQRKSVDDHDLAFFWGRKAITKFVPEFETKGKILISDREFKRNDYMPNTDHVYCWNHIVRNLDYKARDMHIGVEDRQQLQTDIYRMLSREKIEDYDELRQEVFQNDYWTPNLQ